MIVVVFVVHVEVYSNNHFRLYNINISFYIYPTRNKQAIKKIKPLDRTSLDSALHSRNSRLVLTDCQDDEQVPNRMRAHSEAIQSSRPFWRIKTFGNVRRVKRETGQVGHER
jgi:hypothetical protein